MLTGAQAYRGIDDFYESFAIHGWWSDAYVQFRRLYLLHSAFYRAAVAILIHQKILGKREIHKYETSLDKEKEILIKEIWSMKNGEIDRERMALFIKFISSCVYDIMEDWVINSDGKLEYLPAEEVEEK